MVRRDLVPRGAGRLDVDLRPRLGGQVDRGVVVAEVGGVAAHLGAGGGGGRQRGRGVDEAVVGRDLLLARGGGEQPAGAGVVTSVGWKERGGKIFVWVCAERKLRL